MTDFYHGDDKFPYPMGLIQMLGKTDVHMLRKGAPKMMPDKGVAKMAKHSIDFFLTTEDLPLYDNRVALTDDGSIQLIYQKTNEKAAEQLRERLKGMLTAIGCENHLMPCAVYLGNKIPLAGVAHQAGTLRFGDDPKEAVLDINCRIHGVTNCYVVDSSFFWSASAVNPTLTIVANALRVAEQMKGVV